MNIILGDWVWIIPIFRGMNIHFNPAIFWCEQKGYYWFWHMFKDEKTTTLLKVYEAVFYGSCWKKMSLNLWTYQYENDIMNHDISWPFKNVVDSGYSSMTWCSDAQASVEIKLLGKSPGQVIGEGNRRGTAVQLVCCVFICWCSFVVYLIMYHTMLVIVCYSYMQILMVHIALRLISAAMDSNIPLQKNLPWNFAGRMSVLAVLALRSPGSSGSRPFAVLSAFMVSMPGPSWWLPTANICQPEITRLQDLKSEKVGKELKGTYWSCEGSRYTNWGQAAP